MPGPKPMPAQLHVLRGNPSKKPLASLLDEVVRPEVEIPEPPATLQADALEEWQRITPHLQRLGLITALDRAALVAYCIAWGDLQWAERRIAEHNATDPTGERARVWDTPSGYKQISVLLQIRNRAMEQTKTFLAEFGMSPAARSRVTASDPQGELPGMEKPSEGGWGNFR